MTDDKAVTARSWDQDKLLISAISMVNPQLGRYALRLVDVDAQVAEELPVTDEVRLGLAVSKIGADILRRAEGRGWVPETDDDGQ